MSMRAVERFIKKQMGGDTEKALDILEQATGLKQETKKGGQPKVSQYSEFFWYLHVWSQMHNHGKSFDKVETELMNLNAHIKKVDGSVIKSTVNRSRYYIWEEDNKEFLKQDNAIQIKNLEITFEQIKEDMVI